MNAGVSALCRSRLSRVTALLVAAIIVGCAREDAVTTSLCIAEPCEVPLAPGGKLALTLSPRPLKAMRPITARVQVSGAQAPTQLRLEINGADMDMGFNQTTLRRQPDGGYLGEFVLPVCVTGRMRWRLDVRDAAGGGPPLARLLIDVPG